MHSASWSLAVYIINGWVVVWDVCTNRLCRSQLFLHLSHWFPFPTLSQKFSKENKSTGTVFSSLTDIWKGGRFNKALYWQVLNGDQLIRTVALERVILNVSSLDIRQPMILNHRIKLYSKVCLGLTLCKWDIVKLKRDDYFFLFFLLSPSSSCFYQGMDCISPCFKGLCHLVSLTATASVLCCNILLEMCNWLSKWQRTGNCSESIYSYWSSFCVYPLFHRISSLLCSWCSLCQTHACVLNRGN